MLAYETPENILQSAVQFTLSPFSTVVFTNILLYTPFALFCLLFTHFLYFVYNLSMDVDTFAHL